MLKGHFRQAAAILLEWAIRISPLDARVWGLAMQGELNQVEGAWAALMWALGGAGVLLRRALASALIPSRRGQGALLDGGLFEKKVSLRGAALGAGLACLLGAMLFFAAPPFRQALRISLTPWYSMLQGKSGAFQPGLGALARQARRSGDAEGLAFCAIRMKSNDASARLAAEAVALDRSLLWVYAVVAAQHPQLPEISSWLSELQHGDPQNAVIPLLAAEHASMSSTVFGTVTGKQTQRGPAWEGLMATAFRSEKFDDYLDRLEQLDRRVVVRYRFYEPEAMVAEGEIVPASALEHAQEFGSSRIGLGNSFEAKGNWNGAREEYWSVARFGQLIDSQARTDLERRTGAALQAMAYLPLQASYEKKGAKAEAGLFGYLTAKFESTGAGRAGGGDSTFGEETWRRNATVLTVSGLFASLFSGVLAIAVSIVIAAGVRGARRALLSPRPAATPTAIIVAFTSAVGLLLSCATLYLTYRPYWYIFQHAILNGDTSHTGDLRNFLAATLTLPTVASGRAVSLSVSVYFWTGLILIAFTGLILSLLRFFRERAAARESPLAVTFCW